jgi:hypothetical protein
MFDVLAKDENGVRIIASETAIGEAVVAQDHFNLWSADETVIISEPNGDPIAGGTD